MIQKVLVSLCAICTVFSLSSCRSAKEAITLSTINGEWSIIEINGSEVVLAEGQDFPFIAFETATNKVHGNSGCNRFFGTFEAGAKVGKIELGTLASTRMMCMNMTLENNVMNTLKNVKGYKIVKDKLALTNSRNRPIMVLVPKISANKIADLEGDWKITEIKGNAVPTDLEKKPFLSFDTKSKRIHGNAGCNMINGAFVTSEENPKAISFPAIAATMMACPDMTIERGVLNALNEVKSFDVSKNESVVLYNESGETILKLTK